MSDSNTPSSGSVQTLRLIPFEFSHAKSLLDWLQNTDAAFLLQFAGPGYRFPLNEAQLFSTMNSPGYRLFTAVDTRTECPIGHCQIMELLPNSSSAHIGRILIDPLKRGHGNGRGMLLLMMRYAVVELDIRQFTLRVFSHNETAVSCYRSLGFTIVGRESKYYPQVKAEWECLTMQKQVETSV